MDWLAFISSMTSALAWPVVIAAIAVYFRAEIKNIVWGMKRLKVGSLEAEFEREAREVRNLAIALSPRSTQAGRSLDGADRASRQTVDTRQRETSLDVARTSADIDSHLLDLVTSPNYRALPRSGILSVWNAVEDAIRSLAERVGAKADARVLSLLSELERLGALSGEEVALLRRLMDMRDAATMSTIDISEDAVLDYVSAASAILRKTGLSDKPGRSSEFRARRSHMNVPLE